MNNPMDYAKIILIAFAGVWVINRGLKAAGLGQYAATKTVQAAASAASSSP
jgi:hypothetical protein